MIIKPWELLNGGTAPGWVPNPSYGQGTKALPYMHSPAGQGSRPELGAPGFSVGHGVTAGQHKMPGDRIVALLQQLMSNPALQGLIPPQFVEYLSGLGASVDNLPADQGNQWPPYAAIYNRRFDGGPYPRPIPGGAPEPSGNPIIDYINQGFRGGRGRGMFPGFGR